MGAPGSGGPVERLIALQRHLSLGQIDEAERLARDVIAAAPHESEGHNALGVVLRRAGRLLEAEKAYRTALACDPGNARARNNLGDVYKVLERYSEAIAEIEAALRLDPELVEGWRNLANCAHAAKRFDMAIAALDAADRLVPEDKRLLRMRAMVEHDYERYENAATAYRRYLALVPDDVEARTDFGMALVRLGREGEAIAEFGRVLAIKPDHLPAEFGLRDTMARQVPPWHLPMMNEPKRNHAYRDAIRAVVQPDDHVLDIGTGAGLLALLAAEAGAHSVTSCEMVPVVAEEAAAIISRSAWADRISVVSKKSTDLVRGDDMPGRADVLVSEILADDFVGEGVLSTLIDAHARLLKPGARIIPASGAVMGVLVGGPDIEYHLGLGDTCGFDMASFARFRPWRQAISRHLDYEAFSDDVALLAYDFADVESLRRDEVRIRVRITRPGLCYGVLQWLSLELAPGISYDNHPLTTQSIWNKTL